MNKKFILTVLMSIIILGPIGQFIIFRFTSIYDLNLLTNLYNEASWVKGKPKIAIMGSSHARYHIIPDEIAKQNKGYELKDIVNIGENAASPFAMYTSFMKNKEKFSELETVYYTLEPHMLGEKYYTYNAYEEILLSYKQWEYLEENHKKKNNYFFPFQTFVKSLKFTTLDRSKNNGYSSLKHKKFNEFSKGKVSKIIYEPLELFPVSSHGIQYLKKLKYELNEQETQLVFVLTPTFTWQKYYAEEAKKYDDMLINLLNKNLGKSKVIGSFWPEDFSLFYEDFKDDTHLAHSGARKFTYEVFNNIKSHTNIKSELFQNTFLYRFKSTQKQCSKNFTFELNASSLDWEADKYGKIHMKGGDLVLNANNIEKFTYIDSKFITVKDVNEVILSIDLPIEKLTMFSITLRNNKEYAHFFIKPDMFENDKIKLSKQNISQASKNFEFLDFNAIRVRLYPKKLKTIHNFKLKTLKFNICKIKDILYENNSSTTNEGEL